jgi:DHA1 family bicyclomycin/chloramphenicol resistance-like MFS transporter
MAAIFYQPRPHGQGRLEAIGMSLKEPSYAEFVALVALLTAMVAMSIDTMLPALGTIATDLGAVNPNSRQYVLTTVFAGLCAGQLLYGPLSDSIGRKPAILAGLIMYATGALLCLFAPNFQIMLAGRIIQGFGAAGPRIVSIAMVRDRQAGAAMARVMSLVMSIFILVPIVAPSVGQVILLFANWRAIFGGFLLIAGIAGLWLWLRQPETLVPERRSPMRLVSLAAAARAVVATPVTIGYSLAAGFIFGSFVSYLGMSQQIFAEQYGQGTLFPVYFGLLAIGIGIAAAVNARLVGRFGMRSLSKWALRASVALSLAFLVLATAASGHPPLFAFVTYMFANFFCCGILFGNYNALAMEPMGAIAGMAASIVGSLTSLVSLVLGTAIGQLYDGTVIPMIGGFAGLGIAALIVTEIAERHRA